MKRIFVFAFMAIVAGAILAPSHGLAGTPIIPCSPAPADFMFVGTVKGIGEKSGLLGKPDKEYLTLEVESVENVSHKVKLEAVKMQVFPYILNGNRLKAGDRIKLYAPYDIKKGRFFPIGPCTVFEILPKAE